MDCICEIHLWNFPFWSGAKDHASEFTPNELDEIEDYLTDSIFFDRTPTETEINDLFWFEPETFAECLGLQWDKENDKLIR